MEIKGRKILLGIILVIALWILSGIIVYYNFSSSERGSIGDMFGAINALFSGLALFGIIISILIQQKELNYQRQELAETRLEFKTTRVTNILFKQLDYLNSVINELTYYPSIYKNPQRPIKNVSLEEFVLKLDKLVDQKKKEDIKSLISINRQSVVKTVERVNIVIDLVSELLESNSLEMSEIVQMKKLFIGNVNPFLIPLLHHFIKNLTPFESADLNEKDRIEYELSLIMKIVEFEKEN